MPVTVIHESDVDPALKNLRVRQLTSSFTMQPNGYLEVPLAFLITPNGLSTEDIKKLLPKGGNKLDKSLYNVRNLPANLGLFVKSAQIEYSNGLHIAKLVCSSCTEKPQATVQAQFQTASFSLSSLVTLNDDGAQETQYFSFQAKLPTIEIRHCCLAGEEGTKIGTSVTITTSQYLAASYSYLRAIVPFGDYSKSLQYQWIPYNISNRKALSASKSSFDILESQTCENDGSIVQVANQYSVQLLME